MSHLGNFLVTRYPPLFSWVESDIGSDLPSPFSGAKNFSPLMDPLFEIPGGGREETEEGEEEAGGTSGA